MTSQLFSEGSNQSSLPTFIDQASIKSYFMDRHFLDAARALVSLKGIVLSVLIYCSLWIIYTRTFHPLAKFPGPFSASVSRLWIIRDIIKQNSDRTQRSLHDKHGQIVRIAPDELTVSDPNAISIIYGVKKGFTKTDFWLPLQAKGARYPSHVSNVDEAQHAARRRIVNNVYSMTNILQTEEYIDTCIAKFTEKFERFADSGETVDLARWTQMFSFDVIGELCFSKMFGFMEKNEDCGNLIQSIDTLMPYVTISQVAPRWLRPIIMSPILFSRAKQAGAGFRKFWLKAGAAVAERAKLLQDGVTPRRDILGQFFGIYHEKGARVDFELLDIQQEIRGALFAGSDTTGIALTAILYHLMKNPTCLKKLVEELDTATAAGNLSVPYVRYSQSIKLPYLSACCKEGMRIHPSAALHLPRHVPPNGCMIAGQWIPGGTRVGINPAIVLRNKDVFGDDADSFNPERWLSPKAEHMDRYMFQFGAGARTCLGKNIALAEIYKLVPQILRTLDISLVEPNRVVQDVNYGFHKFDKCEVKVRRRQI